jgi:hypothetical protein
MSEQRNETDKLIKSLRGQVRFRVRRPRGQRVERPRLPTDRGRASGQSDRARPAMDLVLQITKSRGGYSHITDLRPGDTPPATQ